MSIQIDQLLRLQNVTRWQLWGNLAPQQTVASHSWAVAVISTYIIEEIEKEYGDEFDVNLDALTRKILQAAIFHDGAECILGDVIGPAKQNPTLRRGFGDLESETERKLGLGSYLHYHHRVVRALIKWADILDQARWSKMYLYNHDPYGKRAAIAIRKHADEMALKLFSALKHPQTQVSQQEAERWGRFTRNLTNVIVHGSEDSKDVELHYGSKGN